MTKEEFKILKSLTFNNNKPNRTDKLIIKTMDIQFGYYKINNNGTTYYINHVADVSKLDFKLLRKLIRNILPKVDIDNYITDSNELVLKFNPLNALGDYYNSLSIDEQKQYSCLIDHLNDRYNPYTDDPEDFHCSIENSHLGLFFITFKFTFVNKEKFYGKQN